METTEQALFKELERARRKEVFAAYFAWSTADLPPIRAGYGGFRQMHQRCARYANVIIHEWAT